MLGLLTAVAAATAVPLLTTWWFGVRPVDADPHLDRLAAVAGVRTAWLTSTRRHRDSFTYHRGVVLHPALRRALRRRERVADAIVLHELGHVANRDVGRTYRAFVAPVLFLPLVAVPFAVIAAERTAAVEYTARFAVLLVVVGASWLAVLRAREHEADRRARAWDAEAFDAAVAAAPAPRGPWWLSTHPHHRGAAPAARFAGGAAAVVAAVAAVEATASVHHLLPTPLRHPALSARWPRSSSARRWRRPRGPRARGRSRSGCSSARSCPPTPVPGSAASTTPRPGRPGRCRWPPRTRRRWSWSSPRPRAPGWPSPRRPRGRSRAPWSSRAARSPRGWSCCGPRRATSAATPWTSSR
ncbi:M48 family metalloprotease [Actinokineospora soli]|uniref:M48 family metalloprotease n=1 Tax=Actinokineospora soli TaxID=1048753 RepID=A0ABW2TIR1_9PSEU